MTTEEKKQLISQGKAVLGIEFGSTRIKGVLIDRDGEVLAVGFHDWENSFIHGVWTYGLDEIKAGLADCYASLEKEVEKTYGVAPTSYAAIGISAMMHGYIALDEKGMQLAPFQTWRNTNTQASADALTALFGVNIPLRWSIAHLYQRILDKEEHVEKLDFVGTLAAYVHMLLTGERVLGIGDASGMFPIDPETKDYDQNMVDQFNDLIADRNYSWKLRDIFPRVLSAGEEAGTLTEAGARLLDPTGNLKAGIPLCPPEGDAGTGMVATDSVKPGTGNLSAGTSTFAMLVLKKKLEKLHREIDNVTTPDGYPVAMSHANNGTTDLNAIVGIFKEFCQLYGIDADMGDLYSKLYLHSLEGDPDCGGLLAYGYYSGENVTFINEGRPLFARMPESSYNLANLMRVNLYTSLGAVKMGLDILTKEEGVEIDRMMGHGGLFKTKGVAQRYLAAAINAPVTVMDTASEGGAWGIAVLAAYLLEKKEKKDLNLADYLEQNIFSRMQGTTMQPDPEEVKGFETFTDHYKKGLAVEKAAIEAMKW
ncbi:MAG: FGGY-family carbohydrate kinase [Eubacterium sp.]|nr:FGGY-family carbohydrate kinase [Eubacterium sp.]